MSCSTVILFCEEVFVYETGCDNEAFANKKDKGTKKLQQAIKLVPN